MMTMGSKEGHGKNRALAARVVTGFMKPPCYLTAILAGAMVGASTDKRLRPAVLIERARTRCTSCEGA
jgi:hypothetical protein